MSRESILAEARAWQQALGSFTRGVGKVARGKKPGMVQDLKIMYRTQKALTNPKYNIRYNTWNNMVASGTLGAAQSSKLKGKIERRRHAESTLRTVGKGAQYRTAKRLAIGVLGATALYGGLKAAKRFRDRNQINNPQFRQYDVHPEYQYGVSPVERYNKPFYPDDEYGEVGPPRLKESSREDIINSIIATLTS